MRSSSSIFVGILILAVAVSVGQGLYVVEAQDGGDSKLGDMCDKTTPCTTGFECSAADKAGKCTCMPGNHADNTTLACVPGGATVGSFCNAGLGCEHVENSKCSNDTGIGECMCPGGFHGDEGASACAVDSKLGDMCDKTTPCTTGFECSAADKAGKCTCMPGNHADNTTLTCVPGGATVGSFCNAGLGCEHVENSKCSNDTGIGECMCPGGFHGDEGASACAVDSKLGDMCNITTPCTTGFECSDAGKCTCMQGNHADNTTLDCVPGGATVGSVCNAGLGCEHVENSKCSNDTGIGECMCPGGFHGDEGASACAVDSKLGDMCNETTPCTTGFECSAAGKCTCMQGNHADNTTLACVPGGATVGSFCNAGLGCEHVENSKCSNDTGIGKCMCPGGFDGDDGASACAVDSKLGDMCNKTTPCTTGFECSAAGKCTCMQGNHADNTTLACVPGGATVGSFCNAGLGCEHVENSKCSNDTGIGKCMCPGGFDGDDGASACAVDSKFGDMCNKTTPCTTGFECSAADKAGKCTCMQGNHADNTTLSCVPGGATVGSFCNAGLGCEHVENSKCSNDTGIGECMCPGGFHGDDGASACAVDSKFGDMCNKTTPCTTGFECSAADKAGKCTCMQGNHADNTTLSCVPGGATVGSFCNAGLGCEHVENSKCSNDTGIGECMCPGGFHGDDGASACAVDSKFGDMCNKTTPCTTGFECSAADKAGKCTCMQGNHADNTTLSCVPGGATVGSFCNAGLGCEHVENSKCSNDTGIGECMCPGGFHGDDGASACAVDSKLGDMCNKTTPCTTGFECSAAGKCTCMQGNHADDTSLACVTGGATVGSFCNNGAGCEYLTNSKCSNDTGIGECMCSGGFHGDVNATACAVDSKLGDTCDKTTPCTTGFECSSADKAGKCTCMEGNHADNTTLACIPGNATVGGFCYAGVGCEHVDHSKCSNSTANGKCLCDSGFNAKDGDNGCSAGSIASLTLLAAILSVSLRFFM